MKRNLFLAVAGICLIGFRSGDVSAQAVKDGLTDQINAEIKERMKRIPGGPPHFSLSGELKIDNGKYSINGESFAIGDDANVIGDLRPGSDAQARGIIKDGKKIAKVVVTKSPSSHEAPAAVAGRSQSIDLKDPSRYR